MFFYFYQLKEKIKSSPLRQDKFVLTNFFISLALNIAIWLVLAFSINSSSEIIPLHYNIYFGIDLIGAWYKVFIIPFLGLLIFFINFALSYIIKVRLLDYFLVASSTFIQFILLVASIFVVLLNL